MGLGSDPSGGRGAGDDGTSGSSSSRGDGSVGGGIGDSGGFRGYSDIDDPGYAQPLSRAALDTYGLSGWGRAAVMGQQAPNTFSSILSYMGQFARNALQNIGAIAFDAALTAALPVSALVNLGFKFATGKTIGGHLSSMAGQAIASQIEQGVPAKEAVANVARDESMNLPPEARQALLDNADKIGMSIENDFSTAIANYDGDQNGGGARYGMEQYAYADSIKNSDPQGYAALMEEMNRVEGGSAPDFSALEGKYNGGAKVQAPAQADPLGGMAPAKGANYTDQLQNVLGGRGANTVAQGQRFDEFGRMQTGRDRRNPGPPNNRVSTREEDIPKDWSEFVQFSAKRNRQQRADQSLIPQQNNAMMMMGQEQQPFQGFDFSVGK